MSWWNKLFGGKQAGTAAPEETPLTTTTFPVSVEVIPGELSVRIYLHEIGTAGGTIPCWSYVSDGLRAHQQREVVVTLRRERHDTEVAFPEDPLPLFGTLYRLASQGRRVTVGSRSELGSVRFFGHHVLYADAQPLPGVPLPPGCLAAVLINDEELRAVREFGCTRVLSRMGYAVKHFPFQTWSERGRRGLSFASSFEHSLLPPLPDAWREAAKTAGKILSLPDDMLAAVWPE